MTAEQHRNLIVNILEAITEDVVKLADNPSNMEVTLVINDLYQCMRQLSDYSESKH